MTTSPVTEDHPLGTFPLGSHDSWQFHFYSSELDRFFSVRMWASNSVHQAWAWTSTLKEECPNQEMIAHLDACEFHSSEPSATRASQAGEDGTHFLFSETSNTKHCGSLSVSVSSQIVLNINFSPRKICFWQVPGQTEGVFHFPNLEATIEYQGKSVHAFGYCKRYWGDYDGPWGYQFIQGGAADEKTFLWTADATFVGQDEYNYFKVLDGDTGVVEEADKTDTYHNNQRAFWRPVEGPKWEAELSPCGKMMFPLTSATQHSRLFERFGRVQLKKDGQVVFNGFGFNEICFGTVA